jgi:DNA-binding LytR/AlgR family response regulator
MPEFGHHDGHCGWHGVGGAGERASGDATDGPAVAGSTVTPPSLRALAVDDEIPALDELAYLLRADDRVGSVATAADATEALRVLRDGDVDVVFLDIRMPGLDGLELARVLRRFAQPPLVVFVTAHDDRAVDAFDLGAVDYLLKPLRAERLAETLRRLLAARSKAAADRVEPAPAGEDATAAGSAARSPAGSGPPAGPTTGGAAGPPGGAAGGPVTRPAGRAPGVVPEPRREEPDEVIPVELAGRTTMLPRSAVRWVEAQGDYARLHTAEGSHLVRVPLSVLAERWAEAGFVRIHRSYLVALPLIRELRLTATGYVVRIGDHELPVSRRHTRELKDRLVRAAKAAWTRT